MVSRFSSPHIDIEIELIILNIHILENIQTQRAMMETPLMLPSMPIYIKYLAE